jgi:alpha-amylase/alpha-mannosidase (GH57 family)
MTTLIIHGHFYQPPRENPWTGTIDPEPDAQPFHDWNERIHAECYQPNASARILDRSGTEQRVNNYAHISFDFGPTLLSWLERNHAETYARVLAADAESARQNNGHGNAIAQAYNHVILPLANDHDRRTQVRWGLADFRYRFGREPESMWLPETACNNDVLGLLIDEGLRFVILAPQQAARVRSRPSRPGIPAGPGQTGKSVLPSRPGIPAVPGQAGKSVLPGSEWQDVLDGTIDTSIAYNYFHRDGSGRCIAVFFYDQELARAIAFEKALASSSLLVERFVQRTTGVGALVNVATDGESYGHHHKFGELCLAYALALDAPARGFAITNYGDYLARNPAEMEVEITNGPQGEGSSWSCSHGVSRWIRDCGCHTGGEPGWNQSWREPLRKALDIVRDEAALCFEATRGHLFVDPWAARDDAISLILDEQKSREEFLRGHAPRDLTSEEQQRALLFLELQRNALLMYTSCGWFFSDLAGIEPVLILKYAARTIDLMAQLGLPSPRPQFLEILSQAKSNQAELGNGADIYRRLVEPSNPSFRADGEKLVSTLA